MEYRFKSDFVNFCGQINKVNVDRQTDRTEMARSHADLTEYQQRLQGLKAELATLQDKLSQSQSQVCVLVKRNLSETIETIFDSKPFHKVHFFIGDINGINDNCNKNGDNDDDGGGKENYNLYKILV